MTVGKIVFGPIHETADPKFDLRLYQGASVGSKALDSHACNCIGPQPGQSKCPCALRRESEMGTQMITDGVTINGKHYRLVPDVS